MTKIVKEKKENNFNFIQYVKNMKKKTKIILTSVAMSTPIVLGSFLTLPGMGIESLRFIGTVSNFIEEEIPKGKYVIDTDSMGEISKGIVKNALLSSYIGDVMSATNWALNEEGGEADPNNIRKYKAYTELWFEEKWGATLAAGEDIDLYDVSMDLIEFDEAFVGRYHDYGFVNPGITWIFQPGVLGKLFDPTLSNSSWYDWVTSKQTVLEQSQYDSLVNVTGPGISGITVNYSVGANIVNNKVWFLNIQRENIQFMLSTNSLTGLFHDYNGKPLEASDLPRIATPDDLYHPNFTSGIKLAKAGVVFLFILGPLALAGGSVGIHFLRRLEDDVKVSKEDKTTKGEK